MPTPAHSTSLHPLDTFPPFRRWRPSPLRNLVYTFVWNVLIGIVLACGARLFGSTTPFGPRATRSRPCKVDPRLSGPESVTSRHSCALIERYTAHECWRGSAGPTD